MVTDKKFFMATLCVGDAYVSHAIKKKLNGRFSGNENRGMMSAMQLK